jgi:hypothetical protein
MRWMIVVAMIAGCDEHGKGGAQDAGTGIDAFLSGRACELADQTDPTVVGSPSLDCSSRRCVHVSGFTPDLCTATCNDVHDCINALESSCFAGWTCAPVMSTGPFACQPMCVCSDRVPVTTCGI